MPTNPETGRYEEPVYQLQNRQGAPGTYPKLDADGDVLDAAGQKVLGLSDSDRQLIAGAEQAATGAAEAVARKLNAPSGDGLVLQEQGASAALSVADLVTLIAALPQAGLRELANALKPLVLDGYVPPSGGGDAPVEPATYTVATREDLRALTGYQVGETIRVQDETRDGLFIVTESGKPADGGTVIVPLDACGEIQTAQTTTGGLDGLALGVLSWDDVEIDMGDGLMGPTILTAHVLHGAGTDGGSQNDGTAPNGLDVWAPGGAVLRMDTGGLSQWVQWHRGASSTACEVHWREAVSDIRFERVVSLLELGDPDTLALTETRDYVRPEWWRNPTTGLPCPVYPEGYVDDFTLPAPGTDRLNRAQSAQHPLSWAERVANAWALEALEDAEGPEATLPIFDARYNVPVVLDDLYGFDSTLVRRPGVDWVASDNRAVFSDRPRYDGGYGSEYGTLGDLGGLDASGARLRRIGTKAMRGAHFRYFAAAHAPKALEAYRFGVPAEDALNLYNAPFPCVARMPGVGYSRDGAVEKDGGLFENEEMMQDANGPAGPAADDWRRGSGGAGATFQTNSYSAIRNTMFGNGMGGHLFDNDAGPDGVPGGVQIHDMFATFVHSSLGDSVASSGYTAYGGRDWRLRDAAGNHQMYQGHQIPGRPIRGTIRISGICFAGQQSNYTLDAENIEYQDVAQTPYSWHSPVENFGTGRNDDPDPAHALTKRNSKQNFGFGYRVGRSSWDHTASAQPSPSNSSVLFNSGGARSFDDLSFVAPEGYSWRATSAVGAPFGGVLRIGRDRTLRTLQGSVDQVMPSAADAHYRGLHFETVDRVQEVTRNSFRRGANYVWSWYGGGVGAAGVAVGGNRELSLVTNSEDFEGDGAATMTVFFQDGHWDVRNVFALGGRTAAAREAGTALYLRNASFREIHPSMVALGFFEGVSDNAGRTSESAGVLADAVLVTADSGGTVSVPTTLFAGPQDAAFVTVTGPDAGRFTGWTNVGTANAPVLRLAFSGTGSVTVDWQAAVRPLPVGLVWPAEDVMPARGPAATAVPDPDLTLDVPATLDLSALFSYADPDGVAYDLSDPAVVGDHRAHAAEATCKGRVRFAVVRDDAVPAGLVTRGSANTDDAHLVYIDPAVLEQAAWEGTFTVRCQDEWGRLHDRVCALAVPEIVLPEWDAIRPVEVELGGTATVDLAERVTAPDGTDLSFSLVSGPGTLSGSVFTADTTSSTIETVEVNVSDGTFDVAGYFALVVRDPADHVVLLEDDGAGRTDAERIDAAPLSTGQTWSGKTTNSTVYRVGLPGDDPAGVVVRHGNHNDVVRVGPYARPGRIEYDVLAIEGSGGWSLIRPLKAAPGVSGGNSAQITLNTTGTKISLDGRSDKTVGAYGPGRNRLIIEVTYDGSGVPTLAMSLLRAGLPVAKHTASNYGGVAPEECYLEFFSSNQSHRANIGRLAIYAEREAA